MERWEILVQLPICDTQPASGPQSRSTQRLGTTRGTRGTCPAGAGTPCPQPQIPAVPSEMLKRHNANSFALWPPHRCHGAAAENKHNSRHVFSAPSTPWPSAPVPAIAPQDLHGPTLHPMPGHPKGSRASAGQPHGPGSGAGKGHPSLMGDGEEVKVWMETAKERVRTAPRMLTNAYKEPPNHLCQAHPISSTTAGQGWYPAGPEESRSPATTQPSLWHQVLVETTARG